MREIKRKTAFILILASLFLVSLGQPTYLGWLGIFAGACGYALFWKGMHAFPRRSHRFLCSFLWFAFAQGIQLFWMASTTYHGPLMILVYLIVVSALGLQFAFLSLFIPKKAPSSLLILAIAGLWTILEWIRLFAVCGFPWNPVGLAWAGNSYSIGWASLFGIYGLSFWVMLVNLLGYRALCRMPSLKAYSLWLGFAALPFFFGAAQRAFFFHQEKNPQVLSAVLVQTALFPEERDFAASQKGLFVSPWEQWRRILRHIKSAAKGKTDLIVLPESALPLGAFRPFYSREKFLEIWRQEWGSESLHSLPSLAFPLAQEREGTWMLTNAYWGQALAEVMQSEVVIGLDDRDSKSGMSYNAAFHFSPGQKAPQRYEKRVLVPMGEYIPYEWCRKIAKEFGIADSFAPGKEAKVFAGKIPLSPSICVEEIYSSIMRENRKKGARLFVNVTNDVWFPHTLLPKQHFYHSAVRAAENGIPLVRATNTGITGAIDAFGRTLGTFASKEIPTENLAGALHVYVPLQQYATLYTLWGDRGILSVSFLFLVLFALSRLFAAIAEKQRDRVPFF